jgi:hypothetical protein
MYYVARAAVNEEDAPMIILPSANQGDWFRRANYPA